MPIFKRYTNNLPLQFVVIDTSSYIHCILLQSMIVEPQEYNGPCEPFLVCLLPLWSQHNCYFVSLHVLKPSLTFASLESLAFSLCNLANDFTTSEFSS